MDVYDGSIRNLFNVNNNLLGIIKVFIKFFVKFGVLIFRFLRVRVLKLRDVEILIEFIEGIEIIEILEELLKLIVNEILFEYFLRYFVFIVYI